MTGKTEPNFKSVKRFFCTWMLLAVTIVSHSQTTPQKPVVNIPTSPEAAMIGRFGDIPIGYYTGTANISIPLYSLKEGNIEIPLTLSYHSSGIKVEDQATWVGLGWDLSPEGLIIQEVRGTSDEDDLGYYGCDDDNFDIFLQRFAPLAEGLVDPYMFLPQWGRATAPNECNLDPYSPNDPSPPLSEEYYDSYCVIDKLLRGFTKPDIYHYNFGGYSGKFYFNPQTNEIVLIDRDKQIYFEIINTTTIQATTLDGTVWTFGAAETASGGTAFEYTGKSYKLSNVTTLTGRTIDFTYEDYTYTEQAVNQAADITVISGYPISQAYSYTTHHNKTLTRIATTDTYIDFNLDSRQDINVYPNENVKKLSSIDITARATNKKIKTIEFNYSYFPYNSTGVPVSDTFSYSHAAALGKRLRLDSLREIGYTDSSVQVTTMPAYKFDYDTSTIMPLKVSFAKDFYGYYNGAANTTLLPNLDYFEYFRKPEYEASPSFPLSYPYTGADRFTDNTKAGAYMLKTITYPTGGRTEFEYEPNSFTNQFIPDKSQPVFKSKDVQDNSIGGTTSILFKLSRATTIHFENRINNGAGNYNGVTPLTYNQMTGCYIKLSKVKLVDGSPIVTLIKQWDLSTVLAVDFDANGGKTWMEDLWMEYDPDPNPTFNYLVQVYFPDNLNNPLFASIAGVTSHFTYYDDTGVDTTESRQCGMRIKSVRNYTSDSTLASHKQIKYYNGKLLNRFKPLTVYPANYLDLTWVTNGNSYEYITFFKKIKVSGNSFGVEGGNPIGYERVEEIELAQSSPDHGKKIFTYLNTENSTHQDCPYSPNLRNGLIAKEEIYNSDSIKLTEKDYTYFSLLPNVPNYPCVNIVRLATGPKVPCGNVYYDAWQAPVAVFYYDDNNAGYIGSEYGFNGYSIKSEWNKLLNAAIKRYANGNELTTTESYTYNRDGNISTLTTKNSKGENLITKYYYPWDSLVNIYADTYMINVHNTGTPVIIEQYKDSLLLSRQKTVNGSFAGVPTLLPQYFYLKKGDNPEERRTTVDSYDNKGNITQYTDESGIPVSIVWNADKTLPVAKIENATYASLLALPNGLSSDFRASLPNAMVTTYTYKPLIGLASETDPTGRATYYEYDGYGRLSVIRDRYNNILKSICYNYAGQPEDCYVLYQSATQSGNFTRNNCDSGYTGGTVTYTVAAGTYSSTISQADANQQALDDIAANGQAYANANGTCTLICTSGNCTGQDKKCVYGVCETGIKIYTSSHYNALTNQTTCIYHYEWSDGSWSSNYNEYHTGDGPFCPVWE